jgi:hypothetical protein
VATTMKIRKLVIDKVDRIEVEEMKAHDGIELLERSIVIWDEKGDKYEIVLVATSQAKLAFHSMQSESTGDWLKPKLYKGSSLHEEEEG